MKKKEKAKFILETLNGYYPQTPIPLDHRNSFTLLIAVVLSAQSTDKKVNEITKDLFEVASTPKGIVKLGEQSIYKYIKQIGLARTKAKNIYNLSKIIIEKHNSNIPNNFSGLESLPGVGHKTASVIMAQIFQVPTFPVDTHIHRLAQRWKISSGVNVRQTEKDLKDLFPINAWNKLHLQMIFYGREYCTARGCDGRICTICKGLFPNRKKAVKCKKA